MTQRQTRNNHAKIRHDLDRQHSSRGQKNDQLEERVPLAGYEISRRGQVFPLDSRVVPIGGYQHSPFIRITANGAVVTLRKEKAIADSWAARDAADTTTPR
jgi:hypothetical protein